MLRDVVQEPEFSAALAALQPNLRRADEFLRGVEFALARDPTCGTQVTTNPDIYMIVMNDPLGSKQHALFYVFNDSTVYLLSIL